MAVQIIRNDKGEPQYAVVPYSEYEKLINARNEWEDVPYTASKSDDVTVPNAIVKIMIDQEVSLLAAWRIYRDLSQYDVAEKLGTTQSTVSQWEASGRPQKRTREKLAALYDCSPEQLIP
ncbi:helix-turn-helix domain-containing protein [Serratia fonticola]|jgi:DNA-binding transcriptional regulator YiaG|uniref:helix-turn-helix domain-containing protein n=1 Tax=Serratia fonticola TaxID=47917 RepID=UPI0034C686E2